MKSRWVKSLTVVAAALMFGLGCDDNGGLGSISIDLPIHDQKIPGYVDASLQPLVCSLNLVGSSPINTDILTPISFSIKASDELKGRSEIGFANVEVAQIRLSIIPPSQSGQTWDFLDSVKLYAQVVGSATPPVLVAELDPVPRGQTTISVKGTGQDISDIASADNFRITGVVSGRPPCADIHFDGEADFDVSVF